MRKINIKILIISFLLLITSSVLAITIESKKQEIQLDNNKGYFTGDVKVQVGDVKVTSPRAELDLEPATKKPSLATFFDKPYAFQIKENKKHEIKADIIKVSLIKKVIIAKGASQTNVLEDKKPTIIITADTQEYDTNTNLMKATGNVVVNYEDMVATADSAYALLDKKGDVHNIKLQSRATIKHDKSIIKGDSIQYSKLRQDIIVAGNTLSDITFETGERVIVKARNQQYDRKGNSIIASGAVHIDYDEYKTDGPKAIMTMNSQNKPEKITFVGRSKIVQNNSNSVEADRIIMTVKPKTFTAEGNVKTNIEQEKIKKDNKMEFSL